jgi:membrane protease YdiL (CAAX protease family)
VSALLFALVHVHPYLMINALFLGLLFALIRLRTGSLLLCMMIHGIYNAIPFLLTRAVSLQIPGYTSFPAEGVQFQPIWFDAIGVALTALGLAGLRFASRPE